ncbi:MAG: hypothetical protein GX913_03925 [Clostridiales bacterium]|nr:hypothetical protein [Clostridiales bacterium]
MYSYTLIQWILFFFLYCVIGWCIESTIVSVRHKKFVNRGFLRLPMLPLYGSGAVLILFITLPYKDVIWKVYIAGMLGDTILEYITGLLMESFFKIKYWDYSDQKLHFRGRICLSSSLFWGVLSVFLTEYIHEPIERFVLNLNQKVVLIIVAIVLTFMAIDTIRSVREALDLSKVLNRISRVKEEIEYLRGLLDEFIEGHTPAKETMEDLKRRIKKLTNEKEGEISRLAKVRSRLVKVYPSAYSKKFNNALKELREKIKRGSSK